MKTLLWLDDMRDPKTYYTMKPKGTASFRVVWVKSFQEFVDYLVDMGVPDAVSFDHDLEPEHYVPANLWKDWSQARKHMLDARLERTGYDCAVALVKACKLRGAPLPIWGVHSANPIGANDIRGLLTWEEANQK